MSALQRLLIGAALLISLSHAEESAPRDQTQTSHVSQRITAYEPSYFLIEPWSDGNRPLNAKFQFSFAFQLVGAPDAKPHPGDERSDGLYLAYSQTSFWILGRESNPFLDSSYRPECFWHQGFVPGLGGSDGLAMESGFAHESNGKGPPDSRGFNALFVRPIVHWNVSDDWSIRIGPRFHAYIGELFNNNDLANNPDIGRYRGNADLDGSIGVTDGMQIAVRGRIGNQLDRGSLQVDLSYPLDRVSHGWMHGYAYLQSEIGYSENLLEYNRRIDLPRVLIGFAITR